MNRQYKIFISSTWDLKPEREEAISAVRALGCTPVAMEHRNPASGPAHQTIKEELEPCDFFVLLAGHKYGTKLEVTGESYVELEHRLAVKFGIEHMVLVKDDPRDESDSAQREFRKMLHRNHTPKPWREPNEVGKMVMGWLFEKILCRQSVDVFDRNATLVTGLREYLKEPARKPEHRTAYVIQYTAVNALEIVRELLLSGIQTNLYVISPGSTHIVSAHQRERLEDNIAQLRNRLALKSTVVDKLLRVYGYDAPGSLRAVMIDRASARSNSDHDFVAIASYVYHISDPKGEMILDIRGGELPGLILRPPHSGFKLIADMVAATVSNWDENKVARLIEPPHSKIAKEAGIGS